MVLLPEWLKVAKDRALQFIQKTTLKQRIIGITLLLTTLGVIALVAYNVTKTDFVQIYSNLSEREAGEVTARLTESGIEYKLTADGKGILVPKDVATQVKVDLAAEGIPKSGVLYNDFSKNMGLGLTDREFSIVERDAIQNELRRLIINGIKGIDDAQVMITLPEETIWVNQQQGQATATVILSISPGTSLSQNQVNALYTIVARSIPKLSEDNIIITNQYGEELVPDFTSASGMMSTNDFSKLNSFKKEIEKDIERGLKEILGSVMRPENVVVKAFATVDYSQITSQEDLVSSPNGDNNGIIISMESLSETWNGEGSAIGGVTGVGETDVPGYQAGNGTGGEQNYEKTTERINYEVNKITRSIISSPYRISDLSISVSVNMATPNPDDVVAVQQYEALKGDIQQVVANVVRTTLGQENVKFSDEDIQKRITVIATPFSQNYNQPAKESSMPWWVIGVIAALVLVVMAAVIIVAMRKRSSSQISNEEELISTTITEIPPLEVEEEDAIVRKQLERLAREKPAEFVSLLRTWIIDE